MLPPTLVRRLVLAPLVVAVALVLIALSPLLAIAALVSGLAVRSRPGARMRSLRLTCFVVTGLLAELATLARLLGLWIASGFGWRLRTEPFQARHYAVVRWLLDMMLAGAARTYGLRIEVDEPDVTPAERIDRLTRPIIVLSRHAGPGDSLLLIRELLSGYGRRPQVVMKASLQFDPCLDVLGNRLPNVFIDHAKSGENVFTEEIERLAAGLGPTGALVIFPEGGNWTPGRWRRGIGRLERTGRTDLASRARDMPNMLPPRPGGALAAIHASPDADVIFVAHSGLDDIVTARNVWRDFPIDQVIKARWWRVPYDAVPRTATHEAQVKWLYDWWQLIDSWVSENRPGGAPPAAVPAAEGNPEPVAE